MQKIITENEKCVCCGADTGIPKTVPLSERNYYVEGCGQLCENCFAELYVHRSDDEEIVSPEEMNELIKMCKTEVIK